MDHIVWLDADANELDNLILGNKSMIIRGADRRLDIPREISEGDMIYLISNMGETNLEATATIKCIYLCGELTVEESFETIIRNQDKLQLPDPQFERYAGKKFLALIELSDVKSIKPVHINDYMRSQGDNWLTVGNVAEYTMSGKL